MLRLRTLFFMIVVTTAACSSSQPLSPGPTPEPTACAGYISVTIPTSVTVTYPIPEDTAVADGPGTIVYIAQAPATIVLLPGTTATQEPVSTASVSTTVTAVPSPLPTPMTDMAPPIGSAYYAVAYPSLAAHTAFSVAFLASNDEGCRVPHEESFYETAASFTTH